MKHDKQRSWEEFKDSGLLWWINMILHTFWWAITCVYNDNGDLISVIHKGAVIEVLEKKIILMAIKRSAIF